MGRSRHFIQEHPSELALRLETATLPELFEEGGRAIAEAMHATPLEKPEPWSERVELEAEGREALLVDWLNALMHRAEGARVVFTEFEIERLFGGHLVAVIHGARVAELRNPVRAATYDGVSLVEHAGRVSARVVLGF